VRDLTDQNEIHERVVNVVAETLKVDRASIERGSRFVEDLGADSLDMFTLMTQLEDDFKATIPETDAEKLTTVGAAVDYIRERARSAEPPPAR
jgi:acyl carrier protein